MKALSIVFGFAITATASASTAGDALPKAVIGLGGAHFKVELALDDASRMRGLMFRESMSEDHGMLFVFDRAEPQAFWMRNTRIPLDIIYFGADARVVSISADTPPCKTSQCPSYPSAGAARFVVELNAGTSSRLALTKGSALCIVGESKFAIPSCASGRAN
ncbi:DUF192 domain-containing protein [Pseudomarimonas arenosa]|uniref:DUF192 domain-containing protein n=1 Tax=Pseudomarimonas arenosa TaxID=2774145 RepID=A0AAW3ZH03_9GAMM|nr:DUF192 domain-containing protein [Pseudomarimonas arenosa]MBD8525098.1 DUF192 domain-containing protein [Pseudomarimonas arenosa]